jgi:hypothetical protein
MNDKEYALADAFREAAVKITDMSVEEIRESWSESDDIGIGELLADAGYFDEIERRMSLGNQCQKDERQKMKTIHETYKCDVCSEEKVVEVDPRLHSMPSPMIRFTGAIVYPGKNLFFGNKYSEDTLDLSTKEFCSPGCALIYLKTQLDNCKIYNT